MKSRHKESRNPVQRLLKGSVFLENTHPEVLTLCTSMTSMTNLTSGWHILRNTCVMVRVRRRIRYGKRNRTVRKDGRTGRTSLSRQCFRFGNERDFERTVSRALVLRG